jgi:heme/copper-type cytochrome/quinol oxidase subunit 3
MLLRHPYHLVDPSPWPLLMGTSGLIFTLGLVCWFTGTNSTVVVLGLISGLVVFIGWWRDVLREAHGGYHTKYVQKGLTIGMLLFLVSEVMLFFSLFWAYFHSSLSPTIELGSQWPPVAVRAIDPWGIPLLGSIVLLSSGFTVTLAHHAVRCGDKDMTIVGLFLTILLGLFFVSLQGNEYYNGEYTMSDSVFGSVFYMTTGLHGIHVIVGVIFLTVCFFRLVMDLFTSEHHLGFEFAIFYWHLVDLVWFFVFTCFYWWGS